MTEKKLQLFMRRSRKGTVVTIDVGTVLFRVRGTGWKAPKVLIALLVNIGWFAMAMATLAAPDPGDRIGALILVSVVAALFLFLLHKIMPTAQLIVCESAPPYPKPLAPYCIPCAGIEKIQVTRTETQSGPFNPAPSVTWEMYLHLKWKKERVLVHSVDDEDHAHLAWMAYEFKQRWGCDLEIAGRDVERPVRDFKIESLLGPRAEPEGLKDIRRPPEVEALKAGASDPHESAPAHSADLTKHDDGGSQTMESSADLGGIPEEAIGGSLPESISYSVVATPRGVELRRTRDPLYLALALFAFGCIALVLVLFVWREMATGLRVLFPVMLTWGGICSLVSYFVSAAKGNRVLFDLRQGRVRITRRREETSFPLIELHAIQICYRYDPIRYSSPAFELNIVRQLGSGEMERILVVSSFTRPPVLKMAKRLANSLNVTLLDNATPAHQTRIREEVRKKIW